MNIVYAVGDSGYRRHVTLDNAQTLCGKTAGGATFALPANCDACRVENGRLIKARRNGGE